MIWNVHDDLHNSIEATPGRQKDFSLNHILSVSVLVDEWQWLGYKFPRISRTLWT